MRATSAPRAIVRGLAYVWTGANTLVGLVLGLLSFQRPRVASGIVIFDGPVRGFLWVIRAFKRSAITFGHVVLSNVPLRGRLLAHELHHVRQYERLGVLYVPVYLVVFMFTGYARHPFERAATRAERAGEVPAERPAR